MTFERTSKKVLAKKIPNNPISWVVFLLEKIGRITYKSMFLIGKLFFLLLILPIKIGLAVFRNFRTAFFDIKNIIGRIFSKTKFVSKRIKTLKAEIKYFLWSAKKAKSKIGFRFVKKQRKLKPRRKISLYFPKYTLFTFGILFLLIFGFYLWVLKDLPNPNKLTTTRQVVSTKIYDRNGDLLYIIYNGRQNRSMVKLEELPEYLIQATIAIEDQDFYHHQGFSIRGISRAIERNVFKHRKEGGSTITQQLVKNVLLTPEKTFTRKAKEFVLAVEVELLFSKEEILQMYFNQIPYGGTTYGIEAAAKTFFDKPAQDLSLAEAAMLAGLPAAPTQNSPFGAQPQIAYERKNKVLDRMVEDGYLSQEKANKISNEKLVFAPQKTDIKFPHFVMYIRDLLVKKYGRRTVEESGLEVITTLDPNIQKMAELKVREEISKLSAFHVTNGAALVTDPKTGEILAMVGSIDYFDTANDGNVNLTTSLRQPGSSIKPVNYAVALQLGYKASSIISDTPIAYHISGSEVYAPVNYDSRFHGNVTLRQALACSYNVPAVKVLAGYGVDNMAQMGKNMGITTWEDPSRFGLSLTLGGVEVKMTDMAVVYGTLANMGERVNSKAILKVSDYKGKIWEDNVEFENELLAVKAAGFENQKQNVLNPNIAYILSDILSDNKARTPAFGSNSALVIPNNQVAVKTGTTNEKRDNWTVGYTSDYVVTVWVGNNDNSPMSAVASGVTGASPIWNKIMTDLLKDQQHSFAKPQDLLAVEVCVVNGLLPCKGCPNKTEYFVPGTEPKTHCSTEQMKKAKEEKEKKEKDKILEGEKTEN